MPNTGEKLIDERLDLADVIWYAMRDWDNYIDECSDTETQPIESFEDFIADGVLSAGYHKQEWISVKDRLPKPNKLVLCWWQSGDGEKEHYGFATFQSHGVWYVSNEGMPEVTHWMPLPEPPKGE